VRARRGRGASGAPPALVLGGGPIAVPVTRSLARAGVPTLALGHGDDPVRHSRSCDRFVDVGSGAGVQDRWLEWMTQEGLSGAVVLPCSDDALELIARHRGRLAELGYRPIEANDEVVLAMLDKERTYALAREVGVPAPRTLLVRPGDGAQEAVAKIPLPCAIKPRHSHLFQRHFGLATKAFIAADERELAGHLDRMGELGLEMIVTEVIPGPDHAYHSYYTYMDAQGRPLLHFTKQKLRQYPVGFGLATYHMSVREEETREVGLRFFSGVGLRGVGNVEFKRDDRDGQLKLIECNHRFTAAHALVCRAGIDLALLAYSRAAGRPDPPVDSYRTGVRQWHPVEDMRALRDYRRRGELTTRAWAASLAHPQHFPLFSWSDPWPSVRSNSRFLARLWPRRRR